METLILQSGVRHGRIAEITRSEGDKLSVGRSYDNDLVLTDIHIAPRQLEFQRENSIWHLAVLDQTNPVFLNERIVAGERPAVNPGDSIGIGRTRLTIHSPEQPVDKTRKLMLANWLARDSVGFVLPVVFLLAAILLDLVLTYFLESTDLKWGDLISPSLLFVALVLAWAGLWALGGRIIRQQHHFGLQLIATACVLMLGSFLGMLVGAIAYPFHSLPVTETLEWIEVFVWLAILLNLNLLIATNLMRTGRVALLLSGLVVLGLYSFDWFGESDHDFMRAFPEYSSTLQPPLLQFSAGTEPDDYFERVKDEIKTLQKGD